jgi:hypothetical protein
MIGRGTLLGLVAVVLLGAVFTLRSADPAQADPPAVAALGARIAADRTTALSAVDALQHQVTAAIDEARQGAALATQDGDQPGPHLEAAGRILARTNALEATLRASLRRLAGDLAIRGDREAPRLDIGTGEISAIAGQMASSAPAANGFQRMHLATRTTLERLDAALAALTRHDPPGALAALDQADAAFAVVREWPGQLDTLPVWIDTTGNLLAAVRALAVATRDGDTAAVDRAAEAYRAAAEEARKADLALAIAVAEGASTVTSAPLSAAADIQAQLDATRAAVEGTP